MKLFEKVMYAYIFEKIQYAYWHILPYDWRPGQIWYRFKCWGWKRYSTVRSRYLDHTWCDKDMLLAHSMFEILSKFIEKECSPGIVDWYHKECRPSHTIVVNGETKWVRDEMQDIYNWWHQKYNGEYPKLEQELLDKRSDLLVSQDINDWFEPKENGYYTLKIEYTNEGLADKYLKEYKEFEIKREKELEEYMHRLVNVRQWMWT